MEEASLMQTRVKIPLQCLACHPETYVAELAIAETSPMSSPHTGAGWRSLKLLFWGIF